MSIANYKTNFCAFVLLLASSVVVSNSQELRQTQREPARIPVEKLHTAPGKLLAEGKNRVPIGQLRVITYRLEQISLPEALQINQGETKLQLETAIRLTVVLDRLVNDSYTIWIDDRGYAAGIFKPNELTALIIGNAGLPNNATITVKRGTDCIVYASSTLPEKLAVPERFRSTLPTTDPGNFVRSIRRLVGSQQSPDQADIELELLTSMDFPVRNQSMVLQIGEHEFVGDPFRPEPRILRFRLTPKDFARVRDGDLIKVKYGACSLGGVTFGRLDKSLLNR